MLLADPDSPPKTVRDACSGEDSEGRGARLDARSAHTLFDSGPLSLSLLVCELGRLGARRVGIASRDRRSR